MTWPQALTQPEATAAARSILLAVPAMAFASLILVLRVTLFPAFSAVNGEKDSFLTVMKTQFMLRLKLWGILILVLLTVLVLGFAWNLASLAITFPLWGAWTALLILLSLWMAARFLYLSREESGDYSIITTQRINIDEKWKRQDLGKRRVIQCFIGWIFGVIIAAGWLMSLTDLTSLYLP